MNFEFKTKTNEYVLNSRPKEFQYVLVQDRKSGFFYNKGGSDAPEIVDYVYYMPELGKVTSKFSSEYTEWNFVYLGHGSCSH